MTDFDQIVRAALKKLEVRTGYRPESKASPSCYFGEIEELNLRCYDFTEEQAVELVLKEAEIVLWQNLSQAKEIALRGSLAERRKRHARAGGQRSMA